jgi:hypothetical protein
LHAGSIADRASRNEKYRMCLVFMAYLIFFSRGRSRSIAPFRIKL